MVVCRSGDESPTSISGAAGLSRPLSSLLLGSPISLPVPAASEEAEPAQDLFAGDSEDNAATSAPSPRPTRRRSQRLTAQRERSPPEERESVSASSSEAEDLLDASRSATIVAETETGRVIGRRRREISSFVAEDPQIRATYRAMVSELLDNVPVPHSGSRAEDEADSEPDDIDNEFVEGLQYLEEMRPRPFSRGGGGRAGIAVEIPRSLSSMELPPARRRGWSVIPRGAISEWMPLMPASSIDGGCLACEGELQAFRAQQRRRDAMFAHYASRNDRQYVSALGVLPLLDGGENRLRCRYAIANHTCGCGHPTSFPVILFVPQSRAGPSMDVRLHGLRLRLFLHLVIPGNPMSWSARTPFSGVFPLFGMPRRYWGRFVWIRGDLLFMGYPPRTHRVPLVMHSLALHVAPRIPGTLRYAPLEVTSTVSYGPRADVFLQGASLQWDGYSVDLGGNRLLLPVEVGHRDIRRAFSSRVPPHSFARLRRNEEWEVALPDRPSDSLPSVLGEEEAEDIDRLLTYSCRTSTLGPRTDP